MGVDFTRYKRSAFDSGEDDIVRQVLKPQPYGMIEPLWGAYILVLDNCKSQLADTLGNTNELEKISEALHYAYRLFYCKPSFKSKEIEKKCIEDIKLHRENMAPFLDRVKGDFGKIYFDTILQHYVNLNDMPDYKIPLKKAFVVVMSNQIIKQLEEVANYTPKPGEESEEKNVDMLKDISLEWLKKSLKDRFEAGENINIDEKMERYEEILSEQNSIGDILVLLQKWLSEIFSYKIYYLTSKSCKLNYVKHDIKKALEKQLPTIFDEIFDDLIKDWDKLEDKEKHNFFSSAISTLFVRGEDIIKGFNGFENFRKNFIGYTANSCRKGNITKQERNKEKQEKKPESSESSAGLEYQLEAPQIVLDFQFEDELTNPQKNIIEDIRKELSNNSFGKVDKIIQYIKRAVISNNSVNISHLTKRFGISQLPGKITDLIDELNGTIQKDVELIEPTDPKSTEQNPTDPKSTEQNPTDLKSTEQNPTEPTEIESEERSEIITSFMDLLKKEYEVVDGFREILEENCKSDGYLLTALKNTKKLSVRQKKRGVNNLWTISIKATGRRLIIEEVKGTKKVKGKNKVMTKFRVIGMESHSGGYDDMFKNYT